MSADPDRALLAASLAFAAAAVAGSAVAIRDELPGQPCGISVPLSVPAGLLAGWGAGVAAPWPMPLAAVIAAARSQRTGPSALTGAVCAGIGMGCVLGTAIEPVTCRPHSWSPATRLAIIFDMSSSAALIVAGWRHLADARARIPGVQVTWASRYLALGSSFIVLSAGQGRCAVRTVLVPGAHVHRATGLT
jgi:hypothetical protein